MIIEPLAGAHGADPQDGCENADAAAWKAIHEAFLKYSVLVFRDQELEPADLMRVGARFGEPCYYPFVTGIDYPFIFEVVKENETVNFGGNWHSDTYLRQPPLATLLYALETPAGGDTLFANTTATRYRRNARARGQAGRREQREPQGDRRPPQDALAETSAA